MCLTFYRESIFQVYVSCIYIIKAYVCNDFMKLMDNQKIQYWFVCSVALTT